MRKELFIAFLFLNVSVLDAQLSFEKYRCINEWFQYVMSVTKPSYNDTISSNYQLVAPVVKTYSEAAKELDSQIVFLMDEGKSLDWAMDSLKPTSETLSNLSDEIRRKLIFYLYSDKLENLSKPVKIHYLGGGRDLFICDGVGTPEEGFVMASCLSSVCGGFEYGGTLVVSWSSTSDTLMDSVRARKAFDRACEDGVFISRFNNPKWNKPSSLMRCAAPFYGVAAYRVRARVVYDYKYLHGSDYRNSAPYYVFVFIKNGYEYLVAFEAEGGCFNVENLADYLSI